MIEFDADLFEDQFLSAVARLAGGIDEDLLRATGFAGADIFRDEAKHNAAANAKTYNLYNNIIVKRVEEESEGALRQVYIVTVRNGKRGPGAFYWRFVEYGHKFVPKNTNISKRTGSKIGWKAHRKAAELEYGSATVPAYPYMRPAYESKKDKAVEVMSKTMMDMLKRNATR